MVSGLCRTTMWNQSIPDALRGRLAGIEMLSYSSGPTLGNVEAGLGRVPCWTARFHCLRRRALRRGDSRAGSRTAPVLELRRSRRGAPEGGAGRLTQVASALSSYLYMSIDSDGSSRARARGRFP